MALNTKHRRDGHQAQEQEPIEWLLRFSIWTVSRLLDP